MIEIIFDRNPGDTFLNEERPVFSIKQQKTENWDDYRLWQEKF